MKIKEAERIIHFHIRELKDAPASAYYHLNKRGGLLEHLNNVAKIAKEQFPNDEMVIALSLVHDIGKARLYRFTYDNFIATKFEKDHESLTIDMIQEAGYNLSEEEIIAIKLHHGGFSPFSKLYKFNELAIKLHYCDHMASIMEEEKTYFGTITITSEMIA